MESKIKVSSISTKTVTEDKLLSISNERRKKSTLIKEILYVGEKASSSLKKRSISDNNGMTLKGGEGIEGPFFERYVCKNERNVMETATQGAQEKSHKKGSCTQMTSGILSQSHFLQLLLKSKSYGKGST